MAMFFLKIYHRRKLLPAFFFAMKFKPHSVNNSEGNRECRP